jgi:PAS domain S-box-containing protein
VGTNQDITALRVGEIRAQGITAENQRLLDEAVASRRALLSLVEDLRATQQTQQATLDRYMGLVQNSPDAILVNREDRMVLANDAALRLLGATDDSQIIGRSPYEIFAPDVHEVVRERIRALRADGRAAPVRELKVVRLDGEVVDVDAAASPFDDSGVVAIHIVLRDITDRKRAEAALVALNAELEERVRARTADLEDAYRELESFSYSVSHDLRAPLRAITGFSQILRRRNLEQLDETGRHYLDNISTAGERMGALIEDLLAYSRVGRRDVRREPLDVGAIADAVAATLAPRIIETGASLGVESSIGVPLGDPTLLQQVLLNLMSNGLTYSRPEVPPEITVRSIRHGDHVEVTVEDNGIGISPEHHERVFEVFARLHTEDEIPGTGIGLAIVRKAARLMDGEVSVRSEPGAGSTFTLRLPAAPDDTLPTPIDPLAVGLPTRRMEELP